jgi:hypothetical protein
MCGELPQLVSAASAVTCGAPAMQVTDVQAAAAGALLSSAAKSHVPLVQVAC